MIYNNGLAKCEWLRKKQEEKKILREYGMSEVLIEELRKSDLEDFNAERRFYEHNVQSIDDVVNTDIIAEFSIGYKERTAFFTVDDMLEEIENPQLYALLKKTDKTNLTILLMILNGYSIRDISVHLGTTEKAIRRRLERLKRKI